MNVKLCIPIALGITLMSCSQNQQPANTAAPEHKFHAEETTFAVNGHKAILLSQPQSADQTKPQIISADVLPGRGMNILRVKAYIPGKGVIDLLATPPDSDVAAALNNGPDDQYGNGSFKFGGAILVPFANRIRGKLLPDGKTLETTVLGKKLDLIANWKGKKPGAEPHAMHGLILDRAVDNLSLTPGDDAASATGTINAGNFNGHWPSKSNVVITTKLEADSFDLTVAVKNVGDEDLPVGVGWHPYFAFPSGQREQVKLKIPAKKMAVVNNYDDVFPTGKLIPMKGAYAFNADGGKALEKNFLDDCFVDLNKDASGSVTAEIIDPAAKYGLKIIGLSPEISAFQAYAPPDKQFVAFEPQFNWGDPFGKEWKGRNTGMVTLKPGQSVTYSVQLKVFIP